VSGAVRAKAQDPPQQETERRIAGTRKYGTRRCGRLHRRSGGALRRDAIDERMDMTTRFGLALATMLSALVACSGGDGGNDTPECTAHDQCPAREYCAEEACVALAPDTCRKAADCDAGESCVAHVCQQVSTDECGLAANVAKRDALVAGAPELVVKPSSGKTVKTFTATFASVADDATVQCEVQLPYKDLNGNGAVDVYEDWTKTAEERAADLVGRMTPEQKMALMTHPSTTDAPTTSNAAVSAGLRTMIDAGVRFGRTSANASVVRARATWANNVQEACEASALGIPFVLSSEPAHAVGAGRTKANGFSQWPLELSLAAGGDVAVIEKFGQVASAEFRAIGVRMVLGPSADLATDPRWAQAESTFGEKSAPVSARVAAYVRGHQGLNLGPNSVACLAKHFPGAGAAKEGRDARLASGKLLAYPTAGSFDAHLAAFQGAFDEDVAGVMPGYGIPEAGAWTALGGAVQGSAIEPVGASFNATLLTTVLRGQKAFAGLVVSPWGVLENAGVEPFGAPWGMEAATRAERVAKAVDAGVDQFGGLGDTAPIAAAKTAGDITDAQIDAAAGRALVLMFRLGLFENPYVDADQAQFICGSSGNYAAGLNALNRGVVLLVNEDKPLGWLNGEEDETGADIYDGTQVGDSGNAGNGTMKVLPAPPGEPYKVVGCNYYVLGDFDLDYVRGVAAGYGAMTNDVEQIEQDDRTIVTVLTPAQKMAWSDYVLVRVQTPFKLDLSSEELGLPEGTLEYAGADNASELADVAAARAAINSVPGSKAQLVVFVSGGRPSVVSEILAYEPAGLYYEWGTNLVVQPDKVVLDVAFGVVDGRGTLPVGLPLSNAAVTAAASDAPADGQHPTFVEGFGIPTNKFK
jgi:beta-glucosidase